MCSKMCYEYFICNTSWHTSNKWFYMLSHDKFQAIWLAIRVLILSWTLDHIIGFDVSLSAMEVSRSDHIVARFGLMATRSHYILDSVIGSIWGVGLRSQIQHSWRTKFALVDFDITMHLYDGKHWWVIKLLTLYCM